MEIRLNKHLAQAGVASRREVDRMIVEGRIKVNGQVVQALGYKIDDQKDRVEVDGKRVERKEGMVYLIINKPPGFLVTMKDPLRRPTVQQLLPALKKRVFPVGRLDYDSEGLLLLTNDGELAHRLLHPRFKIQKTYLAEVKGIPALTQIARLEKGIYLDGKRTAPARFEKLRGGFKKSLFKVEIHEGRKREVRRMFEVIGHGVLHLKRIGFGGVKLGSLGLGKWRFLARREVDILKKKAELS